MAAAFFICAVAFQLAFTLLIPVIRTLVVMRELDAQLKDVGLRMVQVVESGQASLQEVVDGSTDAATRAYSGSGPLYVQVRRSDGSLVASSPGLSQEHLPPDAPPGALYRTVVHETSPNAGKRERVRMASFMVNPPGQPPHSIQLGISLATVDQLQRVLNWLLMGSMLLAVVGTGIVGWAIAGIISARIDRVASALRAVTPTRLENRIDLPSSQDELGLMIADLNAMLNRMTLAFQAQDRFMSEVSHELKTPLAALFTEAQVLKYSRDEEAYSRFVLSVEDEMRWLGKLVESFLMLARFGHGRKFIAEGFVPMNDVALDAVEHATMLARQYSVALSLNLYDPGPTRPEAIIQGDAELLRVVVDNLIRNAVQFSKRGDRVEIDVGAVDGSVTITVRDHGPGVPPEYVDRIFQRFTQAPAQKSNGDGRRGSGLGLTIAKSIVDLHQGRITVENHPEGGCIFRVLLPRSWGSPDTPLSAGSLSLNGGYAPGGAAATPPAQAPGVEKTPPIPG